MEHDQFKRLDRFTTTISMPADADGTLKSYQLAGSGARILAGTTDLALQLVTFTVIAWFVARVRPELFTGNSWLWLAPVALIEWHIIYMMLFESFTRGTTPGKRIWRLRVVTLRGDVPRPVPLVVRNIARIFDVIGGFYLAALTMINLSPRRQRLGDRLSRLIVIYDVPLVKQLHDAEVPESIYSTSEDGYLLQSWIEREHGFELESRVAAGVDLAVYLHQKYDPDEKLHDAAAYLRELYHRESNALDEDSTHSAKPDPSTGPV